MASKYLGETFDLHGGALDLIFPHHENEIAQSEAGFKKTFCNVWMHGGFLDGLDGAKMSKSLGNVLRLRDALGQIDAEALRYFFLSTHYRSPLVFSEKSLYDAESRMEYFYESLRKVDDRVRSKDFGSGPLHCEPAKWISDFETCVDDDFNFAGALGILSGLFANINELTDKPPVKDKPLIGRTLTALRGAVTQISSVLGLFEDDPTQWLLRRRDRQVKARAIDQAKVYELLADRRVARESKDFNASDKIRDALKTMGIEIMDTPQGTTWKVLG